MSICRACSAPIAWIKLRSGKVNPVEGSTPQTFRVMDRPGAGAGRRLTLITPAGDVVSGYRAPSGQGHEVTGWESHFARCPEREHFRRRP